VSIQSTDFVKFGLDKYGMAFTRAVNALENGQFEISAEALAKLRRSYDDRWERVSFAAVVPVTADRIEVTESEPRRVICRQCKEDNFWRVDLVKDGPLTLARHTCTSCGEEFSVLIEGSSPSGDKRRLGEVELPAAQQTLAAAPAQQPAGTVTQVLWEGTVNAETGEVISGPRDGWERFGRWVGRLVGGIK
jgi:hypothetical protein